MNKRNYPKGVIKRPNYGIGEYIRFALYQMVKERTILFIFKPKCMSIHYLHEKVKDQGYDVSLKYLIKFVNRPDKYYDWFYDKNTKNLQRAW